MPATLDALRDGMRGILAQALAKVEKSAWCPPSGALPGPTPEAEPPRTGDGCRALAAELEEAVYAHFASAGSLRAPGQVAPEPLARSTVRSLYTAGVPAVIRALSAPVGPFPDDVLGVRFVRGLLPAAEAVAKGLALGAAPPAATDHRERIRRMFVRTLMEAVPEFAADRRRALKAAGAVELSCFNAAVRASKEAEDPPRRQWDSPAFVDIYSTRCGTVNGLLDPASVTGRAYHTPVARRLLSGELTPEALGAATPRDLCPEATAAERSEIARRASQKVAIRESSLFQCPRPSCAQRRCSYQEVQLRGADEPPDYFCKCLACGASFRGRN